VWKENYEKRALKFKLSLFVFNSLFLHIRAFFFRHDQKFFFFNHFFQIFVHFFCFFEKDFKFLCLKMSDLIIFLKIAFKMKVNTMIEKLKSCFSKEKYRMQTIILNWIIQTNIILDEKIKTFWQYVLNDFDNWRFHHSIILNLIAIYFVISKIVNAIKKERNVYQKMIHIIKRLWKKKKYEYAIDQSIEVLRNMRKVVIKSSFIHDAMKAMIKAIEYRLKNSKRKMRKKIISINDDWVKMTTKVFMSSRLLIETRIIVIMSSSFAVRLKEKKNRKTIFVVLFFSRILTLEKKKKNRKTILVVFFFSIVLFSIEKKNKSKNNFCWFLFWSRFVVVVIVIVIYQFWITTRHAIISIAFFINFQRYCDNVRCIDERRRQFFKDSFEWKLFDRAASWFLLFDVNHARIVVERTSLTKKSSKDDFINIKKARQIVKRIVQMRHVNKMTQSLSTSQSY
jgi:hypothetical protein